VKTDVPYLDQILESIVDAREFTRDGRVAFDASRLIQYATIRALQVMAEATKRLSPARKATHPEVPWRQIAAFRNVLVHEYARVDIDAVWRVLEQDLPTLEQAVRAMRRAPPMEPGPRDA
jgi:uncharacterized protein with HEPN domain